MNRTLWSSIEDGVPGVRLATKRDEGDIFGLLLMMHAEAAPFTMNRDKVIAQIQYATERRGGIIYCIDEGSRVVASLGMVITTDWYTDDRFLSERWNFVHPDYRKSDYARRLLEQGKWTHEWFKANGEILPFCAGVNSLRRTEAKVRLYARHMACIGAYFVYGEPPRLGDQVRAEMKAIEETTKRANAERTREVRPVVETVIRITAQQEEAEHV